jgi:hypothetical protein
MFIYKNNKRSYNAALKTCRILGLDMKKMPNNNFSDQKGFWFEVKNVDDAKEKIML